MFTRALGTRATLLIAGIATVLFASVAMLAACDDVDDPCPDGQFCCVSCGCCYVDGEQTDPE